jgi:hypothetical protein
MEQGGYHWSFILAPILSTSLSEWGKNRKYMCIIFAHDLKPGLTALSSK